MDEQRNTLLTEIHGVIQNERERDGKENGYEVASAFEAYSLILAALERKDAAAKDMKDCIKELWNAVKDRNDGGITAYLGEIERVARESAMAWVRVAALCGKAIDSI